MKISLKVIIIIIVINFILTPAQAAESTPSADPLRQSDSEASIKSKLEELKKEIASKAAILKTEVDRKLKDKAYIGLVKESSTISLTLAGRSGPKKVNLNQDTLYESKLRSRKNFAQKNIASDDYIAALGDVDEQGVLTARKVILLPTPNSELKTYLWGQIVSVSGKLATLKDKDSNSVALSIPTKFDVGANDFVILTGNKGKNDIFEVEFVHVTSGVLKLKKVATSPATLKPTPR